MGIDQRPLRRIAAGNSGDGNDCCNRGAYAPGRVRCGQGAGFAGKLLGALNSSALILMTSIGHRSGLFDALARITPATVKELAAEADLAERYVREWLGVMVTAGVVEYDPAAASYHLPAEHAGWLTRAAAPNNIAVTAQMIGVRGWSGGRNPRSLPRRQRAALPRLWPLHEVMGEHTQQVVVMNLVSTILPIMPDAIARLEAGIEVIDVGCGAGGAVLELAQRFPKSRFRGIDLCEDAYEAAEAEGRRGAGSLNLSFAESMSPRNAVLAHMTWCSRSTRCTTRRTRRDARQRAAFAEAGRDVPDGRYRRLEPAREQPRPHAGRLSLHGLDHALHPGVAGAGRRGARHDVGVELAAEMLGKAGFGTVELKRPPTDPFNAYFVARP